MNREHQGKALYTYIARSRLLPVSKGQKKWESLKEEEKEVYRTIGEGLAQDYIYGGKYELSLSPLDEGQILYNGLFTCALPYGHGGCCHLLLLRSKNRDTSKEEHVQKMAIVSQVPGSLLAIQRQIEQIATLIMDFFWYSHLNHPQDDVTITPHNTRFIEYLPYSALNDTSDITYVPSGQEIGGASEISIVRFQWEPEETSQHVKRNYKASDPSWRNSTISAVNDMIRNL